MSTTTAKLGLVKADPTENVDITQLNANWDAVDAGFSGIQPAYRNVIRNGDMGVAQRGRTGFTTAQYTIDGWTQNFSGGSMTTNSFAQQETAHGQNGASWNLATTVAGQAASTDFAVMTHLIENVRTFSNKQVTLSFLAAASTGTPKIGIEIIQNFGSGGAPSAAVNTTVQAITISSTVTKYSVTFTMPSIAGKTLGTLDDSRLSILFWYSAGSTLNARSSSIGIQNNTFSITDVQLELGAVATAFERLPQQVQLAWCQRYYQRILPGVIGAVVASGLAFNTVNTVLHLPFPVVFRAIPAGNASAASDWSVYDGTTGSLTLTAITFAGTISPFSCRPTTTVSAGLTAGQATLLLPRFTTSWLDFSAEL